MRKSLTTMAARFAAIIAVVVSFGAVAGVAAPSADAAITYSPCVAHNPGLLRNTNPGWAYYRCNLEGDWWSNGVNMYVRGYEIKACHYDLYGRPFNCGWAEGGRMAFWYRYRASDNWYPDSCQYYDGYAWRIVSWSSC